MTVVCIAGSHRSGTSMIARVLNLSGLFLGSENDVSTQAVDNPDGFWENLQFVRLNDEILSKQGGAWDVPPILHMGWEFHPEMAFYRNRAQELIYQFKDHSVWGWKDPRNSLTIDFWKSLLPQQKVVICVRNPLEVVQSLSKRGYSSPRFGFNLWVAYNEHLLQAVSPENRIITHFDSYFSNPRAELERVLAFLEMSASEEQMLAALASISHPLRHNHVSPQVMLDYNPSFELIKLYQEVCAQAGNVYQASLADDDRNQLAQLSNLFVKKVMNSERSQAENRAQIHSVVSELETELAAVKSQLADLYSDIHQKDADLANMASQLAAMQVSIQQKEQDIQVANSLIEEIHQHLGWRLILRYRSMLNRLAPVGSVRRRIYDIPLSIYRLFKKTQPVFQNSSEPLKSQNEGAYYLEPVQSKLPKRAVCTIASKNYLSLVRVFAASMARTNPEIPIYVLIVDRPENKFYPDEEPYHVILLEELENIPNQKHLFFKYTPIELNTAVKPYFLAHLMDKLQIDQVCYFDPDIYIFSKLDAMWAFLDHHSMVLTPHITTPYSDDRHPTELEINLAGVFNLGFLGVSKTPATESFLQWWQERLYEYCYMKPSEGMHVDQNWVNFAPMMYDGVFILRDPAYNIAYWNLHERGHRLKFENESLKIDNRPVVFFHFSGFNPKILELISVHQDRFRLNDFPNVRPVYEFYRDLIEKANYAKIKQWPYAFGEFDNGVKIIDLFRTLYSKQSREQVLKFGDPFSVSGTNNFFSWMNAPVDGLMAAEGHHAISRLQMEIYHARIDLQRAFPDPLGNDRERFVNWVKQNAQKDFNLNAIFIENTEDSFQSVKWAAPISNAAFTIRRFVRSGHHVLKEYGKRALPQDSYLFQKLRSMNKKYFERSFDLNHPTHNPISFFPLNRSFKPFGVNVAGYLQGEFGVAEVARASLASLLAADVPTVLNNVNAHIYRQSDTTFENFSNENPYRVNLVHVNADQVHEFAKQKGHTYFQGRYNIACWFWELSDFPKQWRSSFDYYQEIWVASGFCQESIASQSPIPVVKMTFPILLDDAESLPDRKRFGLPEEKFIFGFVFDYMSFAERKNPFGLINAFKMAFGESKDVLLLIKTINGEHAPEKVARLHNAAKGSNVQFIDGYIPRQDAISLVSSFDSYVSLHRSEGLGIGLAQAMYLKKPVIATGYSGNMEFMNHNNSFLVQYKLTELQENYGPYEKGNVWASPDLDHAAELMKQVFNNRTLAQQVAERAEKDIKTKMTPQLAGQEMKSRLLMVS